MNPEVLDGSWRGLGWVFGFGTYICTIREKKAGKSQSQFLSGQDEAVPDADQLLTGCDIRLFVDMVSWPISYVVALRLQYEDFA